MSLPAIRPAPERKNKPVVRSYDIVDAIAEIDVDDAITGEVTLTYDLPLITPETAHIYFNRETANRKTAKEKIKEAFEASKSLPPASTTYSALMRRPNWTIGAVIFAFKVDLCLINDPPCIRWIERQLRKLNYIRDSVTRAGCRVSEEERKFLEYCADPDFERFFKGALAMMELARSA